MSKNCVDGTCECPTNCEVHCGNEEDCGILVNSGIFLLNDCKIIEEHHPGIITNTRNIRKAINKRIRRIVLCVFALMETYPDLTINSIREITRKNPEMEKMLFNARALEDEKAKNLIRRSKEMKFKDGLIILNGEDGDNADIDQIIKTYKQRTIFNPLSGTIYQASIKYPWLLSFGTLLDIINIDRSSFVKNYDRIRPDIELILEVDDNQNDESDDGFKAKRRITT